MGKSYCNLSGGVTGRQSRLWASVAAVLLVVGCGPSTPPSGELAFGQEPYLRYCASCHGNQGGGKPPTFPPLANSEWLALGPDAVGLIVLYGLRGEIEVAGQTYRGYMPPMQHISDEDIAAILTYLNEAWVADGGAVAAADIARLRGAFDGPRAPLDGREGLMDALDAL